MKIVVIGGVAAGMSAAARARRLDEKAEIVVLERGDHVSFANCGLPYHIGGVIKDRDALLLQTPQSLQDSLNLEVRIRHEATGIDRKARHVLVRNLETGNEYEEKYDKLVLAPGAAPFRPPVPGVDNPRVFVLRNVTDMDRIISALPKKGGKAVVVGAGYIGVEVAENFKELGLDVDIVELTEQILPPFDNEMVHDLEERMRAHGINLHLGVSAKSFEDVKDKVSVNLSRGNSLEADVVVMCVGVRPETTLARAAGLELGESGGIRVDNHMRTSDPDIYAAGDVVEVTNAVTGVNQLIPLAGPANRQGRVAAENICGRNTVYTSTQGTAIVKVFDMTGAMTGVTEKQLLKLGRPFSKIYLHPAGHSSYYPGTAPMHLKLLYDPENGKVLGAQAVGFDGIDKRIDVIATAIRAKMTVEDLQSLELAYAPPYGAAKDPVNMAGFIAHNAMLKDIDFWFAEDFPSETASALLVDVRDKDEFDIWHIPGAVNIPLSQLRSRLDSLPRDKEILCYCKVGFRSYLAYRILKQNSFKNVKTLSGGSLTFLSVHRQDKDTDERRVPFVPYLDPKQADAVASTAASKSLSIDCSGMACPGPIRKLAESAANLKPGDEIVIMATDPGFPADVKAWCRNNDYTIIETSPYGMGISVRVRKDDAKTAPAKAASITEDKKTMVVFSGDLDKVLAAFVIANGALAMGSAVTMFFTFWGLNTLRKDQPQARGKGFIDKMFGWMMPRGADALKLSQMHIMGAGTALMKNVMKKKNVASLPELIDQAVTSGVKIVACTMSMDVMGLKKEELIDGIELGGVAAFLGESSDSGMSLFI